MNVEVRNINGVRGFCIYKGGVPYTYIYTRDAIGMLGLVEVRNNKRYIKIIDYKSGDNSFSPADLLYGTNLQLPVYLDVACRNEESNSGKETVPAALFYYRVNDPIIECGPGESNEEIAKKITSECFC
jgi:ATP-dependent helicase/DNAse subunit B